MDGVKTYSCTVCGQTKTESIPAIGVHAWNSGIITVEASCTTNGVKTYSCTVCGQTKTESIPAIGVHAWNSGIITVEASCTTNGVKTYSCTVCGQTKTEDVPATGHVYFNYKCSSCGLWGIGPAGGYVFYDCDADNDSGNADGLTSSECGWRYLEAAPSDLGVAYKFGYYRTSDSGDNATIGTGSAVGTGKSNTDGLVKAMGKTAYASKSGAEKEIYAAKGCDDYDVVANGIRYDDWFLPSKDELALMYDSLKVKGLGSFAGDCYWSSSEGSDNHKVWNQDFDSDTQYNSDRDCSFRARPIRAFIECIGSVDHSWDTGVVTKQESCGSAGELEYTCTVCGRTRTEVICATDNHTWDGGKVTKQESCAAEGVKTFACSVCAQTKTEAIQKVAHSYVNYKCSVCGQWGKGPAGGYVFFDAGNSQVSSYVNSDGKTVMYTWRYLEAAPADLDKKYPFGYYRTSSSSSNIGVGTQGGIGAGKSNTEALVNAMGESAYIKESGNIKGIYAAKACADYSITVDGKVYDDWFLPSENELNLIYANLYKNGLGSFKKNTYYWSSTCLYEKHAKIVKVSGVYGSLAITENYSDNYVRPIRAFDD